ncbi:menin [Folsomia candida]|uniref:Menin n=1 Tax=Folsomia candida TaxID=158441 RepID=A0A226EE02_FOLCA|nr:menin [Folsomia candida]XP_035707086.1 menin [Folsomia candida]OXA55649.1 Menin [Folsomia candida]
MSLNKESPRFLSNPESKSLFPLQTIFDLEKLFELEFLSSNDPNLAVLSIILGAVENSLVQLDYSAAIPVLVNNKKGSKSVPATATRKSVGAVKRRKGRSRPVHQVEYKDGKSSGGSNINAKSETSGSGGTDKTSPDCSEEDGKEESNSPSVEGGGEDGMSDKENVKGDFPPLELDIVEALFFKFYQDVLKTYVDITQFGMEEGIEVDNTPKELVKRVSDVVWSLLSGNYKADTPHIQSLYMYLTDKKLDSFGVSLAVTAGCQLLGLKDVHLMMSEDHSWVGFGGTDEKNRPKQMSEVTWHGKGVEDKRGKEVGLGEEEDSWLYQKGHAVYCSRHMEVAAIVTSINSAISTSLNSIELVKIQQILLWKLYENGHLKKYPMGLMALADLEEVNPTSGKPTCPTLYQDAVLSGRTYYGDMHIYPYTSNAAYFFRHNDFKTSLKYWAHAARIVQKFRRSKNDEEIYREFFEISTDALVTVMKSCSTGFQANSIVRDPMCFAHLLRIFDGICSWEERSKSSIVHITWAKAWVQAIGRFDYTIRRLVSTSDGTLLETVGKSGSKENGTAEDEIEKDSGIDEEDEPPPRVTLFSQKMRQMKGFFKLEKYNPSAITLLLTAQTAVEDAVEKESNGPGFRSRRERLSQSLEIPKVDNHITNNSEANRSARSAHDDPPSRKRSKISPS